MRATVRATRGRREVCSMDARPRREQKVGTLQAHGTRNRDGPALLRRRLAARDAVRRRSKTRSKTNKKDAT